METSNALHTLVLRKMVSFRWLFQSVDVACRIAKRHKERVPDCRTSYEEGPTAKYAESVALYGELTAIDRT